MALYYRKRIPITRTTHVNVSKTGASVSKRIGKRVTVNTHGRVNVRLGKGLNWRIGR